MAIEITVKPTKVQYYYDMIPDLGFVGYYEKEYFSKNNFSKEKNTSDDGLFSIYEINNNSVDIESYRAVILSDIQLSTTNTNINNDEIFQQLESYSGRYVYLAISSDIDEFRTSINVKPSQESSTTDINYISVLRF